MRRLALVALLLAALAAQAAEETAVIVIAITRDPGESVQGVEVEVDGVTQKTDAHGISRFIVKAGKHHLQLSDGQAGVAVVAAGQTIRWSPHYRICVCQRITLSPATVDRDDAPIATPLTRALGALPLGRTIADVARLAPGADPANTRNYDAAFIDGLHANLSAGAPAMALPVDFFEAANVISDTIPAELGHASGNLVLATPRKSGAGFEAFAYFQPSTHSEHRGLYLEHGQWDAGLAYGRKWLFAAYDHATARDRSRAHYDFESRTATDAFLLRAQTPKLVVELAGDPTIERAHNFLTPPPSGAIGGFVEATDVVRGTTIDALVSHRHQRTDFATDRARLDLAHDLGTHLLRAGVEREQTRWVANGSAHGAYTAAYATDMWQPSAHVTINAGLRAEEFAESARSTSSILIPGSIHQHELSPRASIVWLGDDGLRAFATYANTAVEPMVPFTGYLFTATTDDTTTAGIEKSGYGLGYGARFIHRRSEDAALLTASLWELGGMIFRASYLYTDRRRAHRHDLIAEGMMRIGSHLTTGAVVQAMRNYVSADLHAGVRVAKTEFVIDVFNLLGRESLIEVQRFGFAVYQPPRSIRFGVRTAL